MRLRGGHRDPHFVHALYPGSGIMQLALELERSASRSPLASTIKVATPLFRRRERMRPASGCLSNIPSASVSTVIAARHRHLPSAFHCFSPFALPIVVYMNILSGLGPRARALFSDNKGPWGPASGSEPEGGDNQPSRALGRNAEAQADRWRLAASGHFARRLPTQGA